MSEVQEQPPSLRQLQNRRKAGTAIAEELETLRSYERESKQRTRDAKRAQTHAGRKMASSTIIVNKDEAEEILKERGLKDGHGKSARIRNVIYRLSKTAAEILGLPGPNYHLLRWGFISTKIGMTACADFVPLTPEDGIADPDGFDDGELVTRRELAAMVELSHASVLAKKMDDNAKAGIPWTVSSEQLFKDAARSILTRHPVDDWASWAIFMCEAWPDVPAKTSAQQVGIARLFGRELQQDDVHEGETVRQYVTRIFTAWKTIGFSPLHPLLFEFDRAFNEPTAFDIGEWAWPSDADAVIDINKLPSLP